jgi:hypothetical protein
MRYWRRLMVVIVCMHLFPALVLAQTPGGEIFSYRVLDRGYEEYHYILLSTGDMYRMPKSKEREVFHTQVTYMGNFWGSITPPQERMIAHEITLGTQVYHYILLSNGDVYRQEAIVGSPHVFTGDPSFVGNFWDGAVSTDQSTWGNVKQR